MATARCREFVIEDGDDPVPQRIATALEPEVAGQPGRRGPDVGSLAADRIARAYRRPPPGSVSLKCDPNLAAELRARHAGITPSRNKRHWNTPAAGHSGIS